MIPTAKTKIKSYERLLAEKRRLKKKCDELEGDMQARYTHLKSNFGSMALNSVLPQGEHKFVGALEKIKDIAVKILGNNKQGSFIESTVRRTIQIIIVRQLIRFATSLIKKKKSKPGEAAAKA